MIADLDVKLSRGSFHLEAAAQLDKGERVGIIGTNGSGKSTLLSAVAGHLPIESGHIDIDGRRVDSGDERPRRWVPAYKRGVGWLGSSSTVFPHMTVRANVEYGLKAGGARIGGFRDETPRFAPRTQEMLDNFDLGDLADRKASTLSTGQKCRTTLARAFAVDPPMVLLDEPFSGLDVKAASRIRTLVAATLAERGTTFLIVTHDLIDLFSLTSRVIVLDQGRIVDDTSLQKAVREPKTQFVADLTGVTLVKGILDGGSVHTPLGDFPRPMIPLVGDKINVAIPQEAIRIGSEGQPLRVGEVSMSASGIVIGVAGDQDVRIHLPMTARTLSVQPGENIPLAFDLSKLAFYDN